MLFENYLANLPLLHSWDGGATWNTGGFERWHLERLHDFLRANLPSKPVLLETGAGNSTIMFLFLAPSRLISIAPDASLFERIRGFGERAGLPIGSIETHVDGSQWILPKLAAANRNSAPELDFALIDGCHGWPTAFVDLEYVNFMLRQDGYLMIDDVQLHSAKEMARLLAEHPGYRLAMDLGKSLVFRKVGDQRHLGEWSGQPYIVRITAQYSRQANPFALDDGDPQAEVVLLREENRGMKETIAEKRAQIERLKATLDSANGQIRDLCASPTYRAGSALLWPFKTLLGPLRRSGRGSER